MSKGYKVFRVMFGWLVRLIFRIKPIGRQNEPEKNSRPFLLVSNHIAVTDPVVISAALKKHQICFMAKKELFKVPILSSMVRGLGAFPIDRSGNDVGAIKHAIKLIEGGKCVGIFPQGHRKKGVNPRDTEVKNGAALICARSKCDVLPVYIATKKRKMGFFGITRVYIGELIKFEDLGFTEPSGEEYTRMTEYIFSKVCDLGNCLPKGVEVYPEKNKKK